MTDQIRFFLPIAKIDKDKQTVSGYASTTTKDLDGEIVSIEAVKKALPGYMAWRNIREMHRLSAVGVAEDAHTDANGLFLTAKIVDPKAWKKCLEGVYKGFSIGGRKLSKTGDTITDLELTEISIVDRPANPDCRFEVAKSAKAAKSVGEVEAYLVKPQSSETGYDATAKALRKVAKAAILLSKRQPGETIPGAESEPVAEKRKVSTKEREALASSGDANPDGSFPIKNRADLENAVTAFGRSKNKKQTKQLIMRRAKELGAEEVVPAKWKAKAEAKAAKATKATTKTVETAASNLRKNLTSQVQLAPGEPSFLTLSSGANFSGSSVSVPTEVKRSDAGVRLDFLELDGQPSNRFAKGMRSAGALSSVFDQIRSVQRDLILESKREKDGKDKGLADRLGNISKDLAGVIGQKAEHEGGEALDLSDADDSWMNSILGDSGMNKTTTTQNGPEPDLGTALLNMVKRAAQPTMAARLDMARKNVKKARDARKECAASIEKAHGFLKACYIAKAATSKKKSEPPMDDDDTEVMGKAMAELQKAFGALAKVNDFSKAASEQIKKAAASRSGQRGQEAADGNSFYRVPAGVEDLSPADLATASPGTTARGSMPPLYPVDGSEYPGKAADGFDLRKFANKDGMVSAEVATLMAENANLRGHNDALATMPMLGRSSGARPHLFNPNAAFGKAANTGVDEDPIIKAVRSSGVRPADLGAEDENTRNSATATVLGTYLAENGKSLMSPEFRGGAGQGRKAG